MGFSRQEYWSGLPCPPGDLPGPGIKPRSPALQMNSLLSEPPGKPSGKYYFASLRVCFWDSRYPDMTQGGANKDKPGGVIQRGGLPQWLRGKGSACNAGDAGDSGSIPGSGRSPGVGHDNPLQHSCLENVMDRGAWQATVHGVTKSWTRLEQLSIAQHRTEGAVPGVTKPEFQLCPQARVYHVCLSHTHKRSVKVTWI